MNTDTIPLLNHPLEQPTAFTPDALIEAVRAERGLAETGVPRVVEAMCRAGVRYLSEHRL